MPLNKQITAVNLVYTGLTLSYISNNKLYKEKSGFMSWTFLITYPWNCLPNSKRPIKSLKHLKEKKFTHVQGLHPHLSFRAAWQEMLFTGISSNTITALCKGRESLDQWLNIQLKQSKKHIHTLKSYPDFSVNTIEYMNETILRAREWSKVLDTWIEIFIKMHWFYIFLSVSSRVLFHQ